MIAEDAENPGRCAPWQRGQELLQRTLHDTGLDLVIPLKEELERSEQEAAKEKRNEQAAIALAHILAIRAPAQRKPASCARDQKEEGHAPRKHESLNDGDCRAALGVLDVEVGIVKYIGGMKKEHAQDGEHAQPVKIVQPHRRTNLARCLLRSELSLHNLTLHGPVRSRGKDERCANWQDWAIAYHVHVLAVISRCLDR